MADHMPELTPPWERIPLYITSFQSSPVRIYAKQTTGRSGTWAGGANGAVSRERPGPESLPSTPLLDHSVREENRKVTPTKNPKLSAGLEEGLRH